MTAAYSIAVLLHLALAADSGMNGPAEAKTTAEIVACAEKEDTVGRLREKPNVSTAEFRRRGEEVFVAWYNPYSGEAACHVYVYAHDAQKGVWVRKVARVFRNTHDVSVEFGAALVVRDVKGKTVYRDPAE